MNNQHLKATLAGYQGPFFPPCIEKLHETLYGKGNLDSYVSGLGRFGRHIPGFLGVGSPTTDDGYDWFLSMNFLYKKRGLAIVFPQTQAMVADRHIALYMRGEVSSDADIENLVKEILALCQPA